MVTMVVKTKTDYWWDASRGRVCVMCVMVSDIFCTIPPPEILPKCFVTLSKHQAISMSASETGQLFFPHSYVFRKLKKTYQFKHWNKQTVLSFSK